MGVGVASVGDDGVRMENLGVLVDAGGTNGAPPRSLGAWAVRAGVLTAEQLQDAYAESQETGEAPGELFVRRGWMTEQGVADALGEVSGLAVVHSATRSEDREVLAALSVQEARRLEVCPLARDAVGNLVVALADPSDARLRELHERLGADIHPVIVPQSLLTALLEDTETPIDAAGDPSPGATGRGGEDGEGPGEGHPLPVTPTFRPANAPDVASPEPLAPVASNGATAASPELLERLHERLVSEHAQATEELTTNRRRLDELADTRAQLERDVIASEAKLEEQALVLSLITAKLTELAPPLSGN